MPDSLIVIEVFGEGVTDLGESSDKPRLPDSGVVPVLLHKLCDSPPNLRVKTKRVSFLVKGSLSRKAWFAKRQAKYNGASGVVFVLDTDGEHPKKLNELTKGRDQGHPELPMAVGVSHPCVETWLLAVPGAIRKALRLNTDPDVTDKPEELPASLRDRKNDPKAVLGRCTPADKPLSSRQTTAIAQAIRDKDLDRIRDCCPIGFEPFAEEVSERIKPLFDS